MTALAATLTYIRVCPNCGSKRPVGEMACEALTDDGIVCGWSLADMAIRVAGMVDVAVPVGDTSPLAFRHCTSGHPLDAGDEMCTVCGADPAPAETEPVTP